MSWYERIIKSVFENYIKSLGDYEFTDSDIAGLIEDYIYDCENNDQTYTTEKEMLRWIKNCEDVDYIIKRNQMRRKLINGSRRIAEVTEEYIKFDDNTYIVFNHDVECRENNYADFEQLDDLARDYTFKGSIKFEEVPNSGFRFGDDRRMFFVPCYTEQNGWYTNIVNIYWQSELDRFDYNKWAWNKPIIFAELEGIECPAPEDYYVF